MIERRRVYHMPKNTANTDALFSPHRELLAFPRTDKDLWNIWYLEEIWEGTHLRQQSGDHRLWC